MELAPLLAKTAEEFDAAARLRSLRLVVDAPAGLVVGGDRDAPKRAISNLVANAVRLAPEGSAVVLAGGAEGRWRRLAVADEGPGIAEDEHDRVFERAWSADGSSTGLGLAIVRQIAMGGGSRVVLWLPPVGRRDAVWAAPERDPMSGRGASSARRGR